MAARIANVLLGFWLFVSAFLWPHTRLQFTNALMMGLLVELCALVAMWRPAIRFVNLGIGVWLVVSSFVLPRLTPATAWNHGLVGAVVFLLALVSTTLPHGRGIATGGASAQGTP